MTLETLAAEHGHKGADLVFIEAAIWVVVLLVLFIGLLLLVNAAWRGRP